MQEWFSHYLAGVSGNIYEAYQFMRPDYRKAMFTLRKEAGKIIRNHSGDLSVLDVACGDAIATRQVFGNARLTRRNIRFVGLDHDSNLLNEARRLWPPIFVHHADMVRAKIEESFDVILCSFAYHHAADSEKRAFCSNLLKWCRPGGHLLVLEICLSPQQVPEYYNEVKRKLSGHSNRHGCIGFLDWTMSSDCLANGEWKVSMSRLETDFKRTGWNLRNRVAIWTAATLPSGTGCHYLHFQPEIRRVK